MTAKQELQATEQKKGPGRPVKYTDGFKKNAVDFYLSSGRTQAEIAQAEIADDLGIPRKTLGKWVQAARKDEPGRESAGEIRKLRREVERLQEENALNSSALPFPTLWDNVSIPISFLITGRERRDVNM